MTGVGGNAAARRNARSPCSFRIRQNSRTHLVTPCSPRGGRRIQMRLAARHPPATVFERLKLRCLWNHIALSTAWSLSSLIIRIDEVQHVPFLLGCGICFLFVWSAPPRCTVVCIVTYAIGGAQDLVVINPVVLVNKTQACSLGMQVVVNR